MDEQVGTQEAARSLAEAGARQQEAAQAQVWLPGWYLPVIGVLVVLMNLAIEAALPWLLYATIAVFGIAIPVAMVTAARGRAVRGSARFGPRGGGAIALFVVAAVVAALVVGFGLAAAVPAYRWPSTTGAAVCAAILILGGPVLLRTLRRDVRAGADG
jgi:hypothetical protein